jgi:hypothetical protein
MRNDMEQAEKSLNLANQVRSEMRATPLQLSAFYRSQFRYHLRHMEDSAGSLYKEEVSGHKRDAFKFGKLLIKTCQKAALYRTECYGLMGTYKWLTSDEEGASKWWQKAIVEGERLGALPQLSRTYAEMAVRNLAAKGEPSNPDVNRTTEPLHKAKTMFGHLKLRQDLDDLNLALSRLEP